MALGQTQSVVSDAKGIAAMMNEIAGQFHDSVRNQLPQMGGQPSGQAAQTQSVPPAQDATASTQTSQTANNMTMQQFIDRMREMNIPRPVG